MTQVFNGEVKGDVAARDIIHCYPGVDCTPLRTGVIIAALGALCWWWLKTRPPAPERPPIP